MNELPPLKGSPLRLHGHRFTEVSLKASEQDAPQGEFALRTSRRLRKHAEHPRKFQLVLTIELGSSTPDQESPYTATVTVEGEFEVAEACPVAARDELVNVTGASILYGACREMLANLTARSVHGMSTLPSVSFVGHNPAAAKAAVRKVTAKKASTRKK